MTPEQLKIQELEKKVERLNDLFFRMWFVDKYVFNTSVYFNGKTYFKNPIGDATDKLGFFGATPVVKQGAITTPSGGGTQDGEARTAIAQIKTALQNLGLTL